MRCSPEAIKSGCGAWTGAAALWRRFVVLPSKLNPSVVRRPRTICCFFERVGAVAEFQRVARVLLEQAAPYEFEPSTRRGR
jgi:hypothetical protein